jgi:diketogulonate reductase-like aldo/keto reductase
MQYRPFGRTGLKISSLVLGTDNLANPTPEAESLAILDAAADAGINLVDTSNSYAAGQAEQLIGKWLRTRSRRDDVLIATKVFYPTGPGINDRGLTRHHIVRACEDSLRRLNTDYIDLYQTHRPDPDTPIRKRCVPLICWLPRERCATSAPAPPLRGRWWRECTPVIATGLPVSPVSNRPITCWTGGLKTNWSPPARNTTWLC